MSAKDAGSDPIWDAVKSGDAGAVGPLLAEDPARARLRDEHGVSIVCVAAYHGRHEVARLLGDLRSDLDIFEAIAVGDLARVTSILDDEAAAAPPREEPAQAVHEGADTGAANSYSPDGFGPLGFACFFGQPEMADLLIRRGARLETPASNPMCVRPIHSAVACADPAIAFQITRRLLEAGASPNVVQQGLYTPLHEAARRGDERLVRLLLGANADVNARSSDGKTAADLARAAGYHAVASLCAPQPEREPD